MCIDDNIPFHIALADHCTETHNGTTYQNAPNNKRLDNIGKLDDIRPRDSELDNIPKEFKETACVAFWKNLKDQKENHLAQLTFLLQKSDIITKT